MFLNKKINKKGPLLFLLMFFSAIGGGFIAFICLFYTAVPIHLLEGLWQVGFKKQSAGMHLLVAGVDNSAYQKRSDTIMLLHVNKALEKISLLSIPRDSMFHMPGQGFMKINRSYAIGGMPLLKKNVSRLLGISIHHSVAIDLKQLKSLFETLGPITLDVKKKMHYQDQAGDLDIDFDKGKQVLSSQKLTEYVRFRNDYEGDIGRIRRQQYFLQSSLEQLKKRLTFKGFIQHLPDFRRLIKTDLSMPQMVSLASLMYRIEPKEISRLVLPGEVAMYRGVSYWRVHLIGLDRLLDEHFFHALSVKQQQTNMNSVAEPELIAQNRVSKTNLVSHKKLLAKKKPVLMQTLEPINKISKDKDKNKKVSSNGTLQKETINQRMQMNSSKKQLHEQRILVNRFKWKIEVLNGNGNLQTAMKVAEFLKEQGFQVVRVDNAGHFSYKKTVLVNWNGTKDAALMVGDVLKIPVSDFVLYNRDEKPLKMSIVVGQDRLGLGV